MKRLLTIFSASAIFLFLALFPAILQAEEISDPDFGYSLDLPEGFKVTGYTPDGMSYQFHHTMIPCDFILKLYLKEEENSTEEILSSTLTKLSASFETPDSFIWGKTQCSITAFSSPILETNGAKGWSTAVFLEKQNAYLVLLSYADTNIASDAEMFILSALNSLETEQNTEAVPGIIATYAFPKTKQIPVSLTINEVRVETSVDKEDKDAARFVTDCEYEVLTLYAKSPLWKEAWLRYYKTVYKDGFARLKNAAIDIYKTMFPYAMKINPKYPEAALNELLLNWVQDFPYTHDTTDAKNSDFTDLVSVMDGSPSDCDSRSLLLCVLLNNMGIDSAFFVSREYSHALYGVSLNLNGAKIESNGTEYLLCETTVKKLKPGLVHRDHSDTEKWIPLELKDIDK